MPKKSAFEMGRLNVETYKDISWQERVYFLLEAER